MKTSVLSTLAFLLINGVLLCGGFRRYTFEVKNSPYTRLCGTKNILTVNGQFPGPTLHITKGETIIVDVYNRANYNISIHWHGVRQPRNPWSDGPAYITQCPIQPGHKFSQKVIFSSEEGTLWWHAHNDYFRATVYGAIVIKPKLGTTYPFPTPHAEIPILLGEWWKKDIAQVYNDFLSEGIVPAVSDAYTINGQPGDFYPCSETFTLTVEYGKTYLLRIVNAAMEDSLYFGIAKHNLTVVGTDASYIKPFKVNYIVIHSGQTMDVLLEANQALDHYYMAAKAYSTAKSSSYIDSTISTAILQYKGNYNSTSTTPSFPFLPAYNDMVASTKFTTQLRSLVDEGHPIDVPLEISTNLFITVSLNHLPCLTCENLYRFSASMNNISLRLPEGNNILQAYYNNISGVFEENFPDEPPLFFDFTSLDTPEFLEYPSVGAKVKVLEYNSTVEIVLQGTNLFNGSAEHPIHLHGHSFYVVGRGWGNFNKDKDPLNYNLVDPPFQNTLAVPKNGWVTIRFKAKNPGVWYMHCHFESHVTWGMAMTFIVKDGNNSNEKMLPPPPEMPQCHDSPLQFVSTLKSFATSD